MAGSGSRLVEWLGGHELIVLVGLFVIAAGSWLFLELTDEVLEGETQAYDEWVVKAMRRVDDPSKPIGPAWLGEIGRDLTALGGMAVLSLVTLAVLGFLWLDGKHAAVWFVLIATSGGLALALVLKAFIGRPRPSVVPHLSYVHTSSFPSGHSMMAAVVYLTLGALLTRLVGEVRLKFYFLAVAALLAGLVGLSRIYMGVHYPTDVLAGWTVGLVWATLCWVVAKSLQERGVIEGQI